MDSKRPEMHLCYLKMKNKKAKIKIDQEAHTVKKINKNKKQISK